MANQRIVPLPSNFSLRGLSEYTRGPTYLRDCHQKLQLILIPIPTSISTHFCSLSIVWHWISEFCDLSPSPATARALIQLLAFMLLWRSFWHPIIIIKDYRSEWNFVRLTLPIPHHIFRFSLLRIRLYWGIDLITNLLFSVQDKWKTQPLPLISHTIFNVMSYLRDSRRASCVDANSRIVVRRVQAGTRGC